ncbi:hypothetical protein RHSIM_Rhsim06G0104300 [Rhododendron simsii]|uniref:Uncharacterized protein n=1 Tax=Rhododendron simsii TaxID=118357 RepID=A0A834GX96_RHOSS|nr:hypothetical protein RHSIM_Rhsim06G0104300 [Rhododendron simsii]
MADAEVAERLISDIGKQLAARKTCPNKDLLVKLLRICSCMLGSVIIDVQVQIVQAESAFPELDQSSSLEPSIKPLINSLVKHNLLQHKDKDIRLLVALCGENLLDKRLRIIAALFIFLYLLGDVVNDDELCAISITFSANDDAQGVRTIASWVIIEYREHHPQSLFSAMSSIIGHILKEKEKVTHSLIDIILQNLLKEEKCLVVLSWISQNVLQDMGNQHLLDYWISSSTIACGMEVQVVSL